MSVYKTNHRTDKLQTKVKPLRAHVKNYIRMPMLLSTNVVCLFSTGRHMLSWQVIPIKFNVTQVEFIDNITLVL